MARTVRAPNVFPLLHLVVSETSYSPVGTEYEVKLAQPYGPDSIPIRSMLTRGSVQFDFPGTDLPSGNATTPRPLGEAVTPFVTALLGKTRIKTTTLTDNVEVQCVTPWPGYKLSHEEVNLEQGAVTVINKGVMVFIFGDNYSINNKRYSSFEMFAVQYNDVTIDALSPCYIVIFSSMLKEV